MNANYGTMECEYTTNEDFEDFKLKPGCSRDWPRPYDHSELYSSSRSQDYYPETNDLEPKAKTEPLFVIDKTKNFKLNRTIQYEVIKIYFNTGLY